MMSPTWMLAPEIFLNVPSFLSFLKVSKVKIKKANYLLVFFVVKFSIFAHSLNVIKFLFCDGDDQDEGERCDIGKQESYFQGWDEL